MKKLFILAAVIATSFIATTGYSQVYVNAHVGVRFPAPVMYGGVYAPAPAPVAYENEFPGYAYYGYPAWNGHFRDRVYYEHYRPVFMRDHRFDRRFDHRGRW
jgi:hypothetical protein